MLASIKQCLSFTLPRARFLLACLFLIVSCLLSLTAIAQSSIIDDLTERAQALTATGSILDRLTQMAGRDDESLAGARVKYQALIFDSSQLLQEIDDHSNMVTERLSELGAQPEDKSSSEPPEIVQTRDELTQEKAKLAVLRTQMEALEASASDALEEIAQTRQEIFTDELSRQTTINRQTLSDARQGFSALLVNATSQFQTWTNFIVNNKPWQAIGSAFIALAVALFLSVNLNQFLARFVDRRRQQPDYFTRVFTAFWASVLPSLATAVFLAVTYLLATQFDLLPANISKVVLAVFISIGGLVFVWNLCRAVFAPNRPNWRLTPLSDTVARKLFTLTLLLYIAYAIDSVFNALISAFSGVIALAEIQGFIASLVIGLILLCMGFVMRFDRDDAKARENAEDAAIPADAAPGGLISAVEQFTSRGRAVKLVRFLLIVSSIIILAAALLGYIGFARFAAGQVIVTGAIFAAMIIGLSAARELSREGVLARTRAGRLMHARGTASHRIEQFGLLAGMLSALMVLLIGIPAILLQWGTTLGEIVAFFEALFTGFTIGGFKISLSGILAGLAIFALVLFLTRLLQRWLTRSVFTRTNIDVGVSNSIGAGIGYVGFALAALLGVTSAGIDLTSLAIVAGALSLGIGFGLQNVVSNFVSGLILLVERPIKVGDWILVGAAEGTVKRISVRATEIETFQKQSIIVPNSELINSQVGNWTFKSKMGRVDIPIGIAYGSRVREAEKILYEIAHQHAMVAKKPEPNVWFVGFGDFSLDFRLRFFLYDIENLVTAETEIRFAILERFGAAGIEIPYPKRDLNLKIESSQAPLTDEVLAAISQADDAGGRPVKKPRSRKKPPPKTASKP